MPKAVHTFEVDRDELVKLSSEEWAGWFRHLKRDALYALTGQGVLVDGTFTVEMIENGQVDGISLTNRNTFLIRFEAEVFPHGG